MAGQALAIHDVAPVIHSHHVKHALGDIDPEDVHFLLHWTRLLWLNRFTDCELIVAHCHRSAQGRGHFITTHSVGGRGSRCTSGPGIAVRVKCSTLPSNFRCSLLWGVWFAFFPMCSPMGGGKISSHMFPL